MKNHEALNETKAWLAICEPVIYHLLINSRVETATHRALNYGYTAVTSCNLGVDEAGFTFKYDPDAFSNSKPAISGPWIIRAYLWFLLGHHKFKPAGDWKVANHSHLARELAINSLMNEYYGLPDTIDYDGHRLFKLPSDFGLPEFKSAEFYFNELQKNEPSEGHGIHGRGVGREPLLWQDNSQVWAEKNLQKLLADFYNHNPNQEPTLLFAKTGHNLSQVKVQAEETEPINWALQLTRFKAKATSREKSYSYKGYSRRLGFPFPSKYKKKIPEIAILVDTSASNLKNFPQVIYHIKDLTRYAKVEVYQADTAITKISSDGWDADFFEFSGLGGTDLGPSIERILDSGFSHLIVLTDGKFEIPEIKNVLWVIFQENAEPKIMEF